MSTTATHHVAPDAKISGHVTAHTAYIQFNEDASFSVSFGSRLTMAEVVDKLRLVERVAGELADEVNLRRIEAAGQIGGQPC